MAVLVVVAALSFIALRTPRPGADVAPENMPAESPEVAVERYDAFGDSITFGRKLGFKVDKLGHAQVSTTSFQGWPALLGYMLSENSEARIEVFNSGYPGDRVGVARIEELVALPADQNVSARALVLIGTNDSSDFKPTESGLGCDDGSCSDTYNAKMRSVILKLNEVGYESIYVATLVPVWGSQLDEPYTDPLELSAALRNARVIEYNEVIVRELLDLPGVQPGPDFFSCFLSSTINRFSLFDDTLHPNKLGYVFMAALWRDAIVDGVGRAPADSCTSPIYVLESLDPYAHGHKQNLLEVGDEYYNNEAFVVTSIPRELSDGIWITQSNADRDNRDEDFLSFDAGTTPVSVYVAYDPAGSPPSSASHEFVPVTLSSDLTVSDADVGAFHLVSAGDVTGRVVIGGNLSGSGAPSRQAYAVIVVPGITADNRL